MSEVVTPDYARRVLVPVANPSTASDLLHLAASLAHPDEGQVFALIVSLGDPETEMKAIKSLEPICEELRQEGYSVKLLTMVSTSVSRGILDTAREMGTDMIVIGLKKPVRGQAQLGPIVESVIEAAPTDVIMYRAAQSYAFKKVIIPIDDFGHVRAACLAGIRLAKRLDIPVEALYVRRSGQSHYEAMAHIEFGLADLPFQHDVKRQVIEGHDTVEAILTRATPDDLVVVGFDERTDFERIMFGEMSVSILNRAPGPVLLVSHSHKRISAYHRLTRRTIAWFRPVLTRIEQDDIVRLSREVSSISLDYTVLIIISALLASLGLMLNSGAVIIGAMLVAPLMQPLIGFSVGLTAGRWQLMRRSAITLVFGIIVSIVVAVGAGLLSSLSTPTSEMLIRSTPTLLDALVAFASGVVGAYATARKDIPAALAGVAIAAALMPPLCTVGLGLALGNQALASGSMILFITNILCIILAATVVFFWLGMYDRSALFGRWRQLASIAILVFLTASVSWELISLANRVTAEMIVTSIMREHIAPAELINVDVERGDVYRVIATVRLEQNASQHGFFLAHRGIELALERPVQLEVIPQEYIYYHPSTQFSEVEEAP